jgi:hypothetical protein
MIFGRVSTLLAPKRGAPSAEQWNAGRALDLAIVKDKLGERRETYSAVLNTVKKMQWLSVVCFLEQVNPQGLALIPGLNERVLSELSQLQSYDPLEAYAACLESLIMGEEIDA